MAIGTTTGVITGTAITSTFITTHWYHGCWNGHWGGAYYRPVVFGASMWGLYGWGYQPVYVNPYYVAPAVNTTPVYNYSQPVVVNNYSTTNYSPTTVRFPTQPTPHLQRMKRTTASLMSACSCSRLVTSDNHSSPAMMRLPRTRMIQ